ncbi:MAG: hypothetical protein VX257_10450 [Planctomycetota bacterium]|nr:hypothetical protein [Planctomycetota bacterium]
MFLLALPVAAVSGCSCNQQADPGSQAEAARKKLEKEKRRPDFEFRPVKTLPYDDRPIQRIKPGHWVTVSKGMRANNHDFQGEVHWTPVRANGSRIPLDRTGYRMTMSRPLYLSKQQKSYKDVEMNLFAPVPDAGKSKFKFDLTDRGGGSQSNLDEQFEHLQDHEYFMVVLARDPQRYTFLKVLDSIKPPSDDTIEETIYYHIVLPKINPKTKQRVPLSSSGLTWTSIAYILWDDLEPGRFTSDQQQALVDWLHWGGQVILSGPESLDTLRGSFLEPYLPAAAGKAVTLNTADFDRINKKWTTRYPKFRNRPLEVKANQPWSAVELKPKHDEGVDVLAATPDDRPLVVEGRVGRGRIAVTAFRLRERDLHNWPGFDNFFNACLLRRPGRRFQGTRGFGDESGDGVRVDWVHAGGQRLDPRLVTSVRYFSRDTGYNYEARPVAETEISNDEEAIETDTAVRPPGSALGGWSDFNAVSNAARDTIRAAAGIEIPQPTFVISVLAVYLIVLVPLNWVVFRVIGRIEWAWVAAPVISIACAGLVIKLAELDIGFARSATELAVVELQNGHSRAHVTRYSAVYTSLSTPYTVEFEDADAQVQPFALRDDYVQELGTSPSPVSYHRTNEVSMDGYQVGSNTTGLIHSEQMVEMGGAIQMTDSSDDIRIHVTNGTDFPLQQAFLFRRGGNRAGDEFAWLGDISSKSSARGVFKETNYDELMNRRGGENATAGRLDMTRLMHLAMGSRQGATALSEGDIRLIAVSYPDEMPGMKIIPEATQRRSAMLVVANLRFGPLAAPQPDENIRWDFRREKKTVSEDGVGGQADD